MILFLLSQSFLYNIILLLFICLFISLGSSIDLSSPNQIFSLSVCLSDHLCVCFCSCPSKYLHKSLKQTYNANFQVHYFLFGHSYKRFLCFKAKKKQHHNFLILSALYSPFCYSSCLFKAHPPWYPVRSDWSAHTRLSQHHRQQQSNHAKIELSERIKWGTSDELCQEQRFL